MSKQIDNLSTEELIQEVEKYSAIWNPSLEEYQNKVVRSQAWVSVITKFIPDFSEKTSAEKSEIDNTIRKRWKSIRTCYARELLRIKNSDDPNTTSTRRKQYQHFNQLRFLDLSKTACTNEEESAKPAPSPKTQNSSPSVPKANQRTVVHVNKRKAENNVESLKKKVALAPKLTELRNYETEREADRMFLLSLVPDLQKVPQNVKLQLKADILNSILKAQQQGCPYDSEPHASGVYHNQTANSTGMHQVCDTNLYQTALTASGYEQGSQGPVYVSADPVGIELIKMETAESYSSLEDRGSPVGSEECDDIFAI